MYKILRLFFILISVALINNARAQNILWANFEGGPTEEATFAMCKDKNNYVIYSGYCDGQQPFWGEKSFCFDHDVFIKKMNIDGETKWIKKFGGISTDISWAVCSDNESNVIGVGEVQGTVFFDGDTVVSNAAKSLFVVKTDSLGNYLWNYVQTIGTGLSSANAVTTDLDGNIYVTGYFKNTIFIGSDTLVSKGGDDIFVFKLNKNGEIKWAKQFGGSGYDAGLAIKMIANNNLFIGGYFSNIMKINDDTIVSNGQGDAILLRIDTVGNFLYCNSIGGSGDDAILAMEQNGINLVLSGTFEDFVNVNTITNTSLGLADIFLTEYNFNDNNFGWFKTFGSAGSDQGYALSKDDLGNIYLAGGFYQSINFGSNTFVSNGKCDFFVTKFNYQGNVIWSKAYGGNSDDFAYGIVALGDNQLFVSGSYSDTLMIENFMLYPHGQNDIFMLGFNDPTIGQSNLKESPFYVYPNPATEFLNLNIDENLFSCKFKICDVNGVNVEEGSLKNYRIDVSNLKAGTYFIEITTVNSYKRWFKFSKY